MDTPINNKEPNKAPLNQSGPNKAITEIYQRVYQKHFEKLNSDMQARVLAVKTDVTLNDRLVDEFIRIVIDESEKEISEFEKKQKKDVESEINPS